ncbi:MAG TPA: hypothetical protein VD993_15410 [Chitinophagaceae bacterium]|nr:hypothetical protein [Chitinophagaceae bacterium]
MQDEQSPSPEYIAAFNQGYIMQKHLPDLADKLSKSLPDTELSQGFKDGQQQYQLEKENNRPKFLRKDRLSNPKHGKDNTKDKGGDFERE